MLGNPRFGIYHVLVIVITKSGASSHGYPRSAVDSNNNNHAVLGARIDGVPRRGLQISVGLEVL